MTNEHAVDSQLFTVRIWQEVDANGHREWRGKLRHVPSGEIRHFRGWAALIPLMFLLLRRHAASAMTTPSRTANHDSEDGAERAPQ